MEETRALRVCPNGHPVPTGQRFCGECGLESQAVGSVVPPPPAPQPADTTPQKKFPVPAPILFLVGLGVLFFAYQQFAKTTLVGTFYLYDQDSAENCDSPSAGYDDISDGTEVLITDEDGKVVGSSELSNGRSTTGGCVWDFSSAVGNAEFYSVEVGRRGKVTWSKAELSGLDWEISLQLGR